MNNCLVIDPLTGKVVAQEKSLETAQTFVEDNGLREALICQPVMRVKTEIVIQNLLNNSASVIDDDAKFIKRHNLFPKRKNANQGKNYHPEITKAIFSDYKNGMSFEDMHVKYGRTTAGISNKLQREGLIRNRGTASTTTTNNVTSNGKWTQTMVNQVIRALNAGKDGAEIRAIAGKTGGAIYNKLWKAGINYPGMWAKLNS